MTSLNLANPTLANQTFLIFECEIAINQPNRTAIDWLASATETQSFSKQHLKSVMQKGAVWLRSSASQNKPQRLRRAKKQLSPGETLFLYYNQKVLEETPKTPKLIEDLTTYSVWGKPKGMLSQGSKWGDHTTLQRWVEMHLQRPTFTLHRLDKATNGLMLLAHTHAQAKQLTLLFENRKIEKIYQAWVRGYFPECPQDYTQTIDGKSAISHAMLLEYDAVLNQSKVQVQIETGRKHQIRKHLSEAGYPLVGDRLYNPDETHTQDLQLTAKQITLKGDSPDLQKTFLLD